MLQFLAPPRYAELVSANLHIGSFACFHAISLERSRFSKNRHILFHALVALKLLVSLISRLVACSARIVVDKQTNKQTNRQTHRPTTVTLAAHARRGLTRYVSLVFFTEFCLPLPTNYQRVYYSLTTMVAILCMHACKQCSNIQVMIISL